MTTSGELTKASLTNVESNERIEFLYNPTEYSISKSISWDAVAMVGFDVPPTEFQGAKPSTISLDLFFDTYEADQDVRTTYTDKVFALTKISAQTRQGGQRGRPPRCLFSWGRGFSFQAVITSVSVTFTLFKADGTPVRAKMKVDLQECEDATAQPPQNPTSQGTYGHKAHVVQPGDNIDLLANKYYGDPKSWRVIADANDLDNPMDLRVGRVLDIVPV